MVIGLLLLYLVIFLTVWPVGLLLARLCKDEIIYRKWFYFLFYFFIVVSFFLLILKRPSYEILTSFYVVILVFIAICKSKDKKFIRKSS